MLMCNKYKTRVVFEYIASRLFLLSPRQILGTGNLIQGVPTRLHLCLQIRVDCSVHTLPLHYSVHASLMGCSVHIFTQPLMPLDTSGY